MITTGHLQDIYNHLSAKKVLIFFLPLKKLFNSLWDCKVTDFAYGEYDSNLFESNQLPDVTDFLDKSNDGIHGGAKTNKYIAELILEKL